MNADSNIAFNLSGARGMRAGGGEVEAIHIFINPACSNIHREAK